MFRKISRKRGVAALSVIAVLALAGGAFAYFTSTGSGSGSATVGSSSPFTVATQTLTGGPLYPGNGSESIPYTVTNAGSGNQNVSGTSAAVVSSSGNIVDGTSGLAVSGCLANWFTATNVPPTLPSDLASGATLTGGSVTVTMSDFAGSQDACQGKSPKITISAS